MPSAVHSRKLPSISKSPSALGCFCATGWGCLMLFSLTQANANKASGAKSTEASVALCPPRAAYSHSASVGKRQPLQEVYSLVFVGCLDRFRGGRNSAFHAHEATRPRRVVQSKQTSRFSRTERRLQKAAASCHVTCSTGQEAPHVLKREGL